MIDTAQTFSPSRFRDNGIAYRHSDTSKSDLYLELLPLLNSGQIELFDNPRLISQIANLERSVARGGRSTVDHPRNGHDDVANAAAGALFNSADREGGVRIRQHRHAPGRMAQRWRGDYPAKSRVESQDASRGVVHKLVERLDHHELYLKVVPRRTATGTRRAAATQPALSRLVRPNTARTREAPAQHYSAIHSRNELFDLSETYNPLDVKFR